jgi:hypothetical protein
MLRMTEENRRPRYAVTHAHDHPRAQAQGRMRVHRLVMEGIIGRCLAPEEIVHHENRNPRDNRPDNLRLFSSQAAHVAYHAKAYPISLAMREKGQAIRAGYAAMTPEARAARAAKISATRRTKSPEIAAQVRLAWARLSPEERTARIAKAAAATKAAGPTLSCKRKSNLARLTPEERANIGRRLQAARRSKRDRSKPNAGSRLEVIT